MKLAWTSRSQYLFVNNFLDFYIQPCQISEKNIFFLNDYLSCFVWKYSAVSQNIIFMSFIYLHFSNCKFLIFCSMDWFRFQKPFAISPFRIPRFLGHKYGVVPWIKIYQTHPDKSSCLGSSANGLMVWQIHKDSCLAFSKTRILYSVKYFFAKKNCYPLSFHLLLGGCKIFGFFSS